MEITIKNEVNRLNAQIDIVCHALARKKTAEVLVLGYMLRHSISGMYVVKRGYRDTIGRQVGKSSHMVRKALYGLKTKGLIKFVGNGEGNNLGCWYFHPQLEGLLKKDSGITFTWV